MTGRITEGGHVARSLLSILVGLVLAGVVMQISGYAPREAYAALGTGATGIASGAPSRGSSGRSGIPRELAIGFGGTAVAHLNTFQLAQSLSRVTPLLFAGLAIALGLRAGLFNIGVQGQMTVGALIAAVVGHWGVADGHPATGALPASVHIPLVLGAGALGGALWGALPGLLKARRGVHEVIATILLNAIALSIVKYLTTHDLKDPKSQAAQTALMAKSSWLTPFVPGSNLTVGLLLALFAAALLAWLIRRTALGYQLRAVGLGAEAAQAAGIPVARTIVVAMALSGALAGIAGAIEVMGVHHRYVEGVAGQVGFDGIAVALLGGLNSVGIVLSALFFGALAGGATYMETLTNVPASIAVIVQAVVILFVAMRLRRRAEPASAPAAEDERRVADAPL